MPQHPKRSNAFIAEIEYLIEHNLVRQWAGDKEGFGITRIIEVLRTNTTDHPEIVAAKDQDLITLAE